MSGPAHALSVFDDGSGGGPALYAGGEFTTAGGVTANRIAEWDGTTWSPLGSGVSDTPFVSVYALGVFDDGSGGGPALHAGGTFPSALDSGDSYLAKWGCAPPCTADVTGNGTVDVEDLVEVIIAWGPCRDACAADVNGDLVVDVQDMVDIILAWGPCP